MIAAGRRE